MLEFHERRRIKQMLYSKPALVILALILAVSVNSALDVYGKARETEVKRTEREADRMVIEKRANALQAKLDALSTERGVEAEIRQKFEVVRPGEKVLVLVDDTASAASATSSEPAVKKSWWRWLIPFF